MKSKVFFLIFIIILAVLTWKGYPIIKNRYLEKSEEKTEITTPPSETNLDQYFTGDGVPEEPAENDTQKMEENQELLKNEGKIFQKITKENCDSECAGFSGENLEYCQEVCGIKPAQENISECDSMSGLKKDYCFKDLAASKKDFKICDQIQDSNIKTTCKNRIIEEILNGGSVLTDYKDPKNSDKKLP